MNDAAGLRTRFTELVRCTIPLQLAPMGGLCPPALVAAVTNAGGVGMMSQPLASPSELASLLEEVEHQTAGPTGVGFLIPFLDRDSLAVAAERSRIVDFFYGQPDPALVTEARSGGALVEWQVGSLAEAKAAADAGCDLIVVQGVEAGGRLRGTRPLLPLLDDVVAAVDVPVLAAGGIGSGRDVAQCLEAGAAGVRMGTRFLASAESGAHPAHVAALVDATADDTVRTDAFSVGWPGGREPHRVLRSCLDAAAQFTRETTGVLRIGEVAVALPRFGFPPPTAETTGAVEAMALYAGRSVEAVHRAESASEIVREVAREAEAALEQSPRFQTNQDEPADCRVAFAAWKGFDSPLRHAPALASCATGGHGLWWTVEAGEERQALTLPPPYVAERTTAVEVGEVEIP